MNEVIVPMPPEERNARVRRIAKMLDTINEEIGSPFDLMCLFNTGLVGVLIKHGHFGKQETREITSAIKQAIILSQSRGGLLS